jgi:hypothetical protein
MISQSGIRGSSRSGVDETHRISHVVGDLSFAADEWFQHRPADLAGATIAANAAMESIVKRVAPLLGVMLLGAACSAEPPPPAPGPVREEATQEGIRLQLETPRSIVRTDEEIEVLTSVVNERGDPVTLWSSGHGPVAFGIFRLEDGLTAEPDWTDDGVAYELPPDETVSYPFQKSASWSPGDPDAGFMRAYAADPVLHLPPGHWRIEARLHGVLDHGELDHDGPQIMLSVTIEVVVTD